ncbi:vacuolar protein sorting-associated protein 41 homolog [Spinacia oleracea]|uniref:Vacuolar protein sorting-associated protein 41 homolog n=1 Tax=Spinacia oleracea TaxID=3562 RepID=A0ABM3QH74_SPIOL|nr:vacuolar protein sorting-associated protein 41 homolog [Spinacia oleracea]
MGKLALVALALNPAYRFLSAVKSWLRSVYYALTILSEIEPQLRASLMTDNLKEAVAELYVRTGQNEKAFSFFADLLKSKVFDFIERHSLHAAVCEKVVQLMMLDTKRATSLLIQQRELITPSDVVSQLLKGWR